MVGTSLRLAASTQCTCCALHSSSATRLSALHRMSPCSSRCCIQVSDKERKMEYDNLFRDVASVLSEKCVNPETNRPYTVTMLERALRDVHFNVDPKKAAKQQALEVRRSHKHLYNVLAWARQRWGVGQRCNALICCCLQHMSEHSWHLAAHACRSRQTGRGSTVRAVHCGLARTLMSFKACCGISRTLGLLLLLLHLVQALPVLKAKFPIERARMRLRVTGPTDRKQDLLDMVDGYDAAVESVEIAGVSVSLVVQVRLGLAPVAAEKQEMGD